MPHENSGIFRGGMLRMLEPVYIAYVRPCSPFLPGKKLFSSIVFLFPSLFFFGSYEPDFVRIQARTASAANSAPVVSHAGEGHGKVSFLFFFFRGYVRPVTHFLSQSPCRFVCDVS